MATAASGSKSSPSSTATTCRCPLPHRHPGPGSTTPRSPWCRGRRPTTTGRLRRRRRRRASRAPSSTPSSSRNLPAPVPSGAARRRCCVSRRAGVGGVATETVTEDMHTTLSSSATARRPSTTTRHWPSGLAPATPDQYLMQRRRWGIGSTGPRPREAVGGEGLALLAEFPRVPQRHAVVAGGHRPPLVAFLIPVGDHADRRGADLHCRADCFSPGSSLVCSPCACGALKQLIKRNESTGPTPSRCGFSAYPVGLACLWWLHVAEHPGVPGDAQVGRRRPPAPGPDAAHPLIA